MPLSDEQCKRAFGTLRKRAPWSVEGHPLTWEQVQAWYAALPTTATALLVPHTERAEWLVDAWKAARLALGGPSNVDGMWIRRWDRATQLFRAAGLVDARAADAHRKLARGIYRCGSLPSADT